VAGCEDDCIVRISFSALVICRRYSHRRGAPGYGRLDLALGYIVAEADDHEVGADKVSAEERRRHQNQARSMIPVREITEQPTSGIITGPP
jgi:hypothetical protein